MIEFVKEIEGVEFVEALRMLAQRAGVKLDKFDPGVADAKASLYEICETSARFFEKQLHHSQSGKQTLKYLNERGLKRRETVWSVAVFALIPEPLSRLVHEDPFHLTTPSLMLIVPDCQLLQVPPPKYKSVPSVATALIPNASVGEDPISVHKVLSHL